MQTYEGGRAKKHENTHFYYLFEICVLFVSLHCTLSFAVGGGVLLSVLLPIGIWIQERKQPKQQQLLADDDDDDDGGSWKVLHSHSNLFDQRKTFARLLVLISHIICVYIMRLCIIS